MREQNKLHYKMYKSGKNWVIAGIITATTIVSLYEVTGTQSFDVKAETSSSISNNTSVLTNRVQLSRSSGADNSATITSSAVNSATSYSSVSSSHSSASSLSSADSVASSNVSLVSTDSSAQSISQSSAQSSNQSSAQSSSESNKSSSSDSSSNQSSGSSSNSKPSILFDATIASNASSVLMDHIKVINGKTYYLNDNNSYAKSEIIKDNSDYYYFGADGTLTTDKPNLSSGTISSNDKIAIYSADGSNIDNIDGFINADSWYRPKEVQNSDGSYRESTPSDYRPLISVWWPSRQVEQNYLNYMSSQGLLQGSFSDSSTSDELDQAASEVRTNIDKSIASNSNNITTIKNIFSNFVNSQPEWNITGENFNSNDGIQGGSLLYGNNPNTTDTNSDYRLINRNPTQQNGQVQYKKTDFTGSEFLLADDVDNSNPVVQAETLNWLYYMMNFGSITKNDSNANFDGVRVDAVDNVDADVLNIISGYFKDAYKTDKSDENANNHLAILEDWSQNDPLYQRDHQNSQISIDTDYHTAIFNSLLSNPNDRTKISSLIDSGIVDRKDDNTENQNIPNYSIVRAHDASVQDIIFKIVNDKMSNSGGLTLENIDKAFEYYNQDENSTNKEYTPYNIPLAYAMTLTNKDTIPRVYYGDMYTDNGQFMANQTIYYDAIQAMLKARSKYVAGGQSMNTVSVNNNQDQILTSVRYGKGALNSTDTGDQLTRTSGIAVVASNDPNLQLATNDKVVINMGAAHKKQAYRQLITSTDDGTKSFDKDSDTNQVIYTDSLGNLTLDSNEIKGYSNPQVSGYLSMWVPVGASDNQDVRTAPSSATTTDNNVFHSNDALDSNVIFEAFSNFQSFAKTNDQYTNAVIANNAKKFKDLGFSYVEMAPQYRSSTDNSFLDSVVQNGYAFTDRYDLGFNTPTKYGTADQLTDAIKALHSQGVKVLADFVPDQLYALPNQQVVSVTRVDSNGVLNRDTDMINTLYQAYSKGSGKDYQYKYGGAFLSKLEEMYPDLFEMKQISTGKPIDPSTIIKVWEAKYLNGTNIQGRGPNYILGSDDNSNYFMVQNPSNPNIVSNVLPNELQGKTSNYGLIEKDGKYRYVTTSGTIATNTFLKDDSGNWYYVDSEGDFVNTPTVIDGRNYYFLSNGISLRNVIIRNPDNSLNYYGNNGAMAKGNGYIYLDNIGKEIYVQKDGSLLVGFVKQGDTLHYYDDDGYQVKGEIINDNGVVRYFNSDQGDLVKDGYIIYNDNFYYAGPDGQLVTGLQNINGNEQFFDENGVQQKGIIENINGHNMYFDAKLGNLVKSDYVLYDGNSYYAGSDGQLVTGLQTIDGQEQYF
ncbi:glycoside hydrolase family 70 protein, partial [Apilactobacillus apinorum]|uniref:glycoside hydrolase family 70 protein n=1 Tax=Apilactobacillus apinorum TaxID=1218495 RepID=UPI0033405E21